MGGGCNFLKTSVLRARRVKFSAIFPQFHTSSSTCHFSSAGTLLLIRPSSAFLTFWENLSFVRDSRLSQTFLRNIYSRLASCGRSSFWSTGFSSFRAGFVFHVVFPQSGLGSAPRVLVAGGRRPLLYGYLEGRRACRSSCNTVSLNCQRTLSEVPSRTNKSNNNHKIF